MIINERQVSATERKLAKLQDSLQQADTDLDRESLARMIAEVETELQDYHDVRSGLQNLFRIESLDDLGPALVRARLARGWTQKQLADAIGVSEQMVQKDEARVYERAGLARLADVLDVLGYGLIGKICPAHLPRSEWRGPERIKMWVVSGGTQPVSTQSSVFFGDMTFASFSPRYSPGLEVFMGETTSSAGFFVGDWPAVSLVDIAEWSPVSTVDVEGATR